MSTLSAAYITLMLFCLVPQDAGVPALIIAGFCLKVCSLEDVVTISITKPH